MILTLTESLIHIQTWLAFIIYCVCISVSIPLFEKLHERLEQHYLQTAWDKIGMPVLRSLLLILFLVMVYPMNFGLANAPAISEIIFSDKTRFDFLFNLLFLTTFIYPVIPFVGKADALMIPLQGIVASMILFSWLAIETGLNDYTFIPDAKTCISIIIITTAGYWFARFLAAWLGEHFDKTFNRDGYRILLFRAFIMILQSPVIFLYGHAMARQLTSGS